MHELCSPAKNFTTFATSSGVPILRNGMFFTVSVFYTYSGILGRNFLILDILLFYSSVIFSFGMSEYISGKIRSPHETEPGFVVSLWLITSFFFFVFTCFPPDLPLFYSA